MNKMKEELETIQRLINGDQSDKLEAMEMYQYKMYEIANLQLAIRKLQAHECGDKTA